MTKIVSTHSFRGGTGKSNTTANLAVMVAKTGKRVGVVSGKYGIGTFSPALDIKGNSVRGIRVFEELSAKYGVHCFETGFDGPTIDDLLKPARRV